MAFSAEDCQIEEFRIVLFAAVPFVVRVVLVAFVAANSAFELSANQGNQAYRFPLKRILQPIAIGEFMRGSHDGKNLRKKMLTCK